MPKKPASRRKVEAAMREVHRNTPAVVKQTARKKGKAAAERQRRKIGLEKARRKGARV